MPWVSFRPGTVLDNQHADLGKTFVMCWNPDVHEPWMAILQFWKYQPMSPQSHFRLSGSEACCLVQLCLLLWKDLGLRDMTSTLCI
jgi:hypothetical protein